MCSGLAIDARRGQGKPTPYTSPTPAGISRLVATKIWKFPPNGS
jgi:hypothetical protein